MNRRSNRAELLEVIGKLRREIPGITLPVSYTHLDVYKRQVMGYAKKNTTRNSNGNMRKKQSEYASQLKEKQKVKFIYGVLEKQLSLIHI